MTTPQIPNRIEIFYSPDSASVIRSFTWKHGTFFGSDVKILVGDSPMTPLLRADNGRQLRDFKFALHHRAASGASTQLTPVIEIGKMLLMRGVFIIKNGTNYDVDLAHPRQLPRESNDVVIQQIVGEPAHLIYIKVGLANTAMHGMFKDDECLVCLETKKIFTERAIGINSILGAPIISEDSTRTTA